MKLIIPRSLLYEINRLLLNEKEFNNIIDFYYQYISYSFQFKEYQSDEIYIPFSSSFLKKRYTTNYYKGFLQLLLENGIVSRRPYFSKSFSQGMKGENHPFSYKFNDSLLDFSDLSIVNYSPKKKKSLREGNIKYVIDDLKKLEFDEEMMLRALEKLSINPSVVTNTDILSDKIIEVRQKKSVLKMNRENALMMVKINGVDLIEHKGEYFFDKKDHFIETITRRLQIYNSFSLTLLLNKDFYGKRNKTNFRLDTNLTNLNKIFFDFKCITLDGEPLVEIDLKNSQPTLLAYLLSNHMIINGFKKLKGISIPTIEYSEDVKSFIYLAQDGTLYDYIASRTGIKRETAKKIFLKIMFSKPGWNSEIKSKVARLFPTIIEWMDSFKKTQGDYKVLAIVLQKIESEIFIDKIYRKLRLERYTVFTKHDCILCKESEYKEVKKIVSQELHEIGLKFKLS